MLSDIEAKKMNAWVERREAKRRELEELLSTAHLLHLRLVQAQHDAMKEAENAKS